MLLQVEWVLVTMKCSLRTFDYNSQILKWLLVMMVLASKRYNHKTSYHSSFQPMLLQVEWVLVTMKCSP